MEKFGGGRKQVEKFENKNNDRLIRGRRSTIRCLMGPRMHSPSMPPLIGSLMQGKSRWRRGNWKMRII